MLITKVFFGLLFFGLFLFLFLFSFIFFFIFKIILCLYDNTNKLMEYNKENRYNCLEFPMVFINFDHLFLVTGNNKYERHQKYDYINQTTDSLRYPPEDWVETLFNRYSRYSGHKKYLFKISFVYEIKNPLKRPQRWSLSRLKNLS